ncbi:efflux RND transporter periplasmic adaptor subunit [Cryomorphaceae bacterium 1068]|nr:efflux RND transporter periplasmic adaptor subunit [Cryomorphaceae bacterium 1068]
MRSIRQTAVKIFSLGLIAIAVVACGGAPQGDLQKLKSERDSLKVLRGELDDRILVLEREIAEKDSTTEDKLVTGIEIGKDTFKHFFEVYGNVQSDKSATIYAENSGVIKSIVVKEGQTVKRGQTLVLQDVELIDRNMAEVRTQLSLAETLYEKQKRLWEQNIGSEVQYLEAKNRKESLENSLATLSEQRQKSSVVAPFDGVVDKIFPKVGELVGMAVPVVRLVNTDELYVNADISERYMGDIAKGDSVWVIVNRNDTIKSAISRVGDYINPANRSFEIRVDIGEKVAVLRPNSLVVLKVNDYTEESAIVVPSSVIMQDGEGNDYVFTLQADENSDLVARKTQIKTGPSHLGKTVVKEGIVEGDELIDKGSRTVRDGDKVKKTTV